MPILQYQNVVWMFALQSLLCRWRCMHQAHTAKTFQQHIIFSIAKILCIVDHSVVCVYVCAISRRPRIDVLMCDMRFVGLATQTIYSRQRIFGMYPTHRSSCALDACRQQQNSIISSIDFLLLLLFVVFVVCCKQQTHGICGIDSGYVFTARKFELLDFVCTQNNNFSFCNMQEAHIRCTGIHTAGN